MNLKRKLELASNELYAASIAYSGAKDTWEKLYALIGPPYDTPHDKLLALIEKVVESHRELSNMCMVMAMPDLARESESIATAFAQRSQAIQEMMINEESKSDHDS